MVRSVATVRRPRCVAVLATVLILTSCSSGGGASQASSGSPAPSTDAAVAAARHFLDTYVSDDGAVLRHDQGDDVVSEGQSYALLLAQVAGDGATFDRIWNWTAAHLMQPDGVLAAHADRDGHVDDPHSAADADVLAAWALLRSSGPSSEVHHTAGRALAAAILEHETLALPDGSTLLAAGNWATGAPGTLNPSYWALAPLADLARLSGDSRWSALAQGSVRVVSELTNGGAMLPPDWARADGSRITATPAPNGQAPDVRYSLDSQRVVVWFATADDSAKPLARNWAALLTDDSRAGCMALGLDGGVLDARSHPLPLVAAASAQAAAGRDDLRDQRLAAADALAREHPTYYGDAWVALGHALLTTDLLRA